MPEKALTHFRAFLNEKWASLLYTVLACLAVSFSLEHYAIPLFILWILFVLLLDGSFLNVFLPVTLLCGFAIRTSGQSTILLNHLWLAVPVVIVIAIHFVLYGQKRKLGVLFFAQAAISAALLLGGLFYISAENYFKPDALYYVFFLGVGMIFFYAWFRNGVFSNEYYDVREKLMECFWYLGIFCAWSILDQTARFLLTSGVFYKPYVWSNDICELMLFCIPATFYYARNRYVYLTAGLAFYGAMFLTQSYSAILCGFLLLVLCFAYLLKQSKAHRIFTVSLLTALCLFGAISFGWLVYDRGGLAALFAAEENGRLALIQNAWRNFLASPIFGVGVGDPGTGSATFMTVNWTHNLLFQVLGSLGIVGLLAYGYQLYKRCRLVFASPDPFRLAAGLSYLGIFLISMFQPGEFCPMPYAMMAVMIFTVLENSDEERAQKAEKEGKSAISA